MFALVMSYRDIRGHVQEMYGIEISEAPLSVYFKYLDYVRKAIYTTSAIEAVHRQFRKLTKTIGAFPNENSLMKLLYVGILNASKKWTMPIHNWNLTLSQLAIHFEGRLDGVLDI